MSGGRYMPADAFRHPRFSGVRTYMRLPHVTDLVDVDVAVLGLPFDTGTSFRSGARFGPEAVRSASGMIRTYNPVLKVQVFLRDINDYAAMNEIFAARFAKEPPTRTTVAAIIPRESLVEIDAVAFV